jgi:flagellar basal body-associated protein FliL
VGTKPDELLNVVIVAVICMGLLLIAVLFSWVVLKYKTYKLNKYVKAAKEREEAEAAKDKAGRINARGKW